MRIRRKAIRISNQYIKSKINTRLLKTKVRIHSKLTFDISTSAVVVYQRKNIERVDLMQAEIAANSAVILTA